MIPPFGTVGASILTNSIQWDSSWPEWIKEPERNQLLGFLQERFGIPTKVFADYHLLRRSHSVLLISSDHRLPTLASLRVQSVGLPLLRWVKTYLKPTSAALQVFGGQANKSIVELSPIQLRELVVTRQLEEEFPVSPGYVMVVTERLVIGCALYLPGRLLSQFPRHLFSSPSLGNT